MTNKPIWLLDVDGVLNALPHRGITSIPGRPDNSWDDYVVGYATPEVAYDNANPAPSDGFQITYSPALMARIRELHESGAVEVRWLTTWGRGANGQLRQLLDLPLFEIAGEPDELSDWSTVMRPNDGTRWWKFFHAVAAHEAEPDRPIIWTDDDLCRVSTACEWAEEEGVFAVSTDDTTGITPLDLQRIEEFIASRDTQAA